MLGELAGALGVEAADDRQDQQPFAHLEDRRRELADRCLLLVDDPLSLLHEAHADGYCNSVGRRLVGVEHAVELPGLVLVAHEQRAREHVAQQQHDPEDLVRLNPAADDALRQIVSVFM